MQDVARSIVAWIIVAAVALLILKFVVGALVGLLWTVALIAVVVVALGWALRHI